MKIGFVLARILITCLTFVLVFFSYMFINTVLLPARRWRLDGRYNFNTLPE